MNAKIIMRTAAPTPALVNSLAKKLMANANELCAEHNAKALSVRESNASAKTARFMPS